MSRMGPTTSGPYPIVNSQSVARRKTARRVERYLHVLRVDDDVERKPGPTAGRARLVVLSAHGKKQRDIAQREVTKVHAEWRKHLSTKEYGQLAATLAKLREVTDPYR